VKIFKRLIKNNDLFMNKALWDTIRGYFYFLKMIAGSFVYIKPKDKKNILFIAWYLPPSISSGVYRPLSLIKYAGEKKIKLSCISGPLEGEVGISGKYLEDKLPHNIPIKKIHQLNLRPSWKFFPRIQENTLIDALAIYFQAIDIYDKAPPKIIIATGPPFSDFIAATFLAKRYSCKLVLDYRDEWSERPFDFVGKNIYDRLFEEICLKHSDAVIFTTKSQIAHQLSVFSFLNKNKCHYIPNGWDGQFSAWDKECEIKESQNKIIISFVGYLGAHSKPGDFLESIGKIIDKNKNLNLVIRFIGEIGPDCRLIIERFKYKEVVEIIGHVPKPRALRYMQESTYLLLLAEESLSRYRPGKLYDYISSLKPTIVYGYEGEVRDVVCSLNAGFFVRKGDWGSLEEILLDRNNSIFSGEVKEKIRNWVNNHERSVLAESFFNVVNNLT